MRLVSTSYISTPEYNDPGSWLKRISYYTGVLEQLSRKHEIISIERINYDGIFIQNGVNYHFINLRKRKLLFPRQMHKYIKKLNPDVVLVHGLHFPLQVMQLRRTLGKYVKILVQHHAEKPFTGVKRFLQRQASRDVDAFLFTSAEMGMDWVKKGNIANPEKIVEVLEATSVFTVMDRAKALEKTGARGDIYLWVGRLNENKDPVTVVKAFLAFVSHHPAARLYMIYHTVELKDEIEKLCDLTAGARDHIMMIGEVAHNEMVYWFNSADFIISGSKYEAMGVAVCEGMSCGCIPVLTDIAPFRKLTGNGNCGVLYERGNKEALLSALLKTRDMDLKKEREKTLKQFNSELSFKAIAERIDQLITSL